MSTRFLLTGGAGFIGSPIVKRPRGGGGGGKGGEKIFSGPGRRPGEMRCSLKNVEEDICRNTARDVGVKDVDYVLHQAAIPSVQRSVCDPIGTNRANVTATLNLLESCRKAKVRRFVYAASSSAYGDTEVLPKSEEMPPNPLSPYALQKLAGEHYCKLYYRLYGLETGCLRYFNVFGPGQ